MIISPKIRGFICTTAHPDGCESHVRQQVDYVKSKATLDNSPKKVLVIGSSTGYGLASRIVPAFAGGADTLGVFFERPANEKKSGSPGWYNSYAFEKLAKSEGLYAKSINGDAFSDDIKNKTIEEIKKKSIAKLKICWIGDSNNVLNSLMEASVKFSFKINIACPKNYSPNNKFFSWVKRNNKYVSYN